MVRISPRSAKVSPFRNFRSNHLLKFSMLPFIHGLRGAMNTASLDLRREGCEIYHLIGRTEVAFLILKGTAPHALVDVFPDVSDADTKARVIDGLLLTVRMSDPDCGRVVTLNQGETMPVPEVGLEFLPYRRLGSWDCEVVWIVEPEDRLHPIRYILSADTAKIEVATPVAIVYA